MSTTPESLLLEQLQKLDKDIADEERALTHLNKQVGQKVSKISDLKEKRRKTSEAYKNLNNAIMEQKQQPVIGLTVGEVK